MASWKKELRAEFRATLHRPSAWITWAITAAVFFGLGYLISHGWHW